MFQFSFIELSEVLCDLSLTMSEDSSVKNVTKFDGKNYQVWKFQVTSLLVANDVYDVIGNRVRPANDAANEANHKKWIKDDAKAVIIIIIDNSYK